MFPLPLPLHVWSLLFCIFFIILKGCYVPWTGMSTSLEGSMLSLFRLDFEDFLCAIICNISKVWTPDYSFTKNKQFSGPRVALQEIKFLLNFLFLNSQDKFVTQKCWTILHGLIKGLMFLNSSKYHENCQKAQNAILNSLVQTVL